MSIETFNFLVKNYIRHPENRSQVHSTPTSEKFMDNYKSDPFFRERINVEIEKLEERLARAGLKPLESCEDRQELEQNLNTLKARSSSATDREIEKVRRYIELIKTCK